LTVEEILTRLMNMPPVKTVDLPRDQLGIYGLIDHNLRLRYIGSTSAGDENFRKRIHQRHRTGSETHSHYFSKIYNCGRMWRDRLTQQGEPDAKIAKDLRSAFIAKYCRAVYVPILGTKSDIETLERSVISAAPSDCVLWNGSTTLVYPEPVELVDSIMDELKFQDFQREAVERQRRRYSARFSI
jgi:hypothetical protein